MVKPVHAAAAALLWAGAAAGQLDPADFDYCNMDPSAFAIPTISPEGLELVQLQVRRNQGGRHQSHVCGGRLLLASSI